MIRDLLRVTRIASRGRNTRPLAPRPAALLTLPLLLLATPMLQHLVPAPDGSRPFAAQAAEIVLSPLTPATKNIDCKDPAVDIRIVAEGKEYCFTYDARTRTMRGFARKSVDRWLQERNLPLEDYGVIYGYGRVDLRADVAARVAIDLLAIFQKPDAERTEEEKAVAAALNGFVNELEWVVYEEANNDLSRFEMDKCNYKPHSTIAAVYGFSYNGAPYCTANPLLTTFRFHVPGPSYEYLYAVGFEKAYGAAGDGLEATMMGGKIHTHLAGLGASVLTGAVAGAAVQANLKSLASKLVDVEEFADLPKGIKTINLPNGTQVVRVFGRAARFLAGGAFSIVTMMVEIGVEAIMQFEEEQKLQEGYARMRAKRGRGGSVEGLLQDREGMYKFLLLSDFFTALDRKEFPLPTHRPGVDRTFVISTGGVTTPRRELFYTDREGIVWTATTWKNWFVRQAKVNEEQISSITPELEIKDTNGVWWLATRIGESGFRMTQISPPPEAVLCPAVNGESARRDRSCSVFFSKRLEMVGGSAEKITVTLGVEPRVEEAKLYFPANTTSTFKVQITGEPRPMVTIANQPAWLRFTGDSLTGNPGPGSGTATVYLDSASVSGRHRAQFTINWGAPIRFLNPDTFWITAGVPFQFEIRATGDPAPKVTKTGWLPSFMTMTENADGSATLRGTWRDVGSPACAFSPLCNQPTVTATNRNQAVGQQLTFRYAFAPQAEYTGPSEIEFLAGVAGRFVLTSRGAQTRVTWDQLRTGLRGLSWIRINEAPDGSVTLSGTPPLNSPRSTLVLDACPYAEDSGLAQCLVGNFRLHVNPTPRFTNAAVASAAEGLITNIPLSVNRFTGRIELSTNPADQNRFPAGWTIESLSPASDGSVRAVIRGRTQAGQGGRYAFTLNWNDGYETTSQRFSLDVLERPTITSPPSFTFFEGSPATGEVTTQGYPVNAFFANCGNQECKDLSVTFRWADSRSIAGLRMVDRSIVEFPTGVGRFEGDIPYGSKGVYRIEATASNGRWAPEFRQPINLVVMPSADLNGDGHVDCQDLQAIRNANGTRSATAGTGFDLTGDFLVDDKDVDAMTRAVAGLRSCGI